MTNKETPKVEVKETKALSVPESVQQALEAVAKVLGVAVTELWTIFVRQYVVRGVTEAFTGLVLCVASYFLFPVIGLFVLIPLAIALMFFYGTIQLLGNPKYYALEDIATRVQDFKNPKEVKVKRYGGYPF